jgi:hypothetical protein
MIANLAEKAGLTDVTVWHEQEYEKYIAWSLFVRARGAPRAINVQRRRPGSARQYYIVYLGDQATGYPKNAEDVAAFAVDVLVDEVRGE